MSPAIPFITGSVYLAIDRLKATSAASIIAGIDRVMMTDNDDGMPTFLVPHGRARILPEPTSHHCLRRVPLSRRQSIFSMPPKRHSRTSPTLPKTPRHHPHQPS